MKPANLLLLAKGLALVPPCRVAAYEAQLSERDEPLGQVRVHEIESMLSLVQRLDECGLKDPLCYEGFVYSFAIPQISREFDLLRITDRMVIDIELKSEDVGIEKIATQLRRTRYYLAPLRRKVRTFTYVSSVGLLYERTADGTVCKVEMNRLASVLAAKGVPYAGCVEELFDVSNYLVSPLNDTRKFLQGAYFLTNQQEMIKTDFIESVVAQDEGLVAFVVYGSAGTGKTLLLYDMARSMDARERVCVIHCGNLCEGHRRINEQQDGFKVLAARSLTTKSLQSCSAILIDEAQRMHVAQLKEIVRVAVTRCIPLYVSLDRRQRLVEDDAGATVEDVVRAAFSQVSVYSLSQRIRTNRELDGFVRTLFGLHGNAPATPIRNVKVAYAANEMQAWDAAQVFVVEGYSYIGLPNGPTSGERRDDGLPQSPTAYDVVGQEFGKVVMAIGPQFEVDVRGRLVAAQTPVSKHRYRRLLYQGLTRARNGIALVVYDNLNLLNRLLMIIGALPAE